MFCFTPQCHINLRRSCKSVFIYLLGFFFVFHSPHFFYRIVQFFTNFPLNEMFVCQTQNWIVKMATITTTVGSRGWREEFYRGWTNEREKKSIKFQIYCVQPWKFNNRHTFFVVFWCGKCFEECFGILVTSLRIGSFKSECSWKSTGICI